ncbi:MAG: hypothetical protein HY647_10510 [Acidobacteria bacterium]|nr:hypothetical protein [Acidobacteriota bacterium]
MPKKASRKRVIELCLGVVFLIVAVVGLVYGSILQEMSQAGEDYQHGDLEGSLAHYEAVEQRLRSWGAIRLLPRDDRQSLILNQAQLLYALERYDDAAERLERENEIAGVTTDGRFFLLRGNIIFRKAVKNYQESPTPEISVLEEQLRAAEDSLRESLRLNANDWDAKHNYEFLVYIRKLMTEGNEGRLNILMEKKLEDVERKPLTADQMR